MNPIIPAASGAGALLISGFFILARRSSGRKHRGFSKDAYIEALQQLADGHLEEAATALKQVVKTDTDNIMAYIELGAVLRKQGHPARASKIHRSLLVRGDLPDHHMQHILHHLVLDYRDAKMLNKAVEMAERLVERAKKTPEYSQLLLSLYESSGEWDKAIMYKQSLNRWQKKDRDRPRLAFYKVKSGLLKISLGAEREGRIRFREALRLDKNCVPAYIHWGESYIREGRLKDAVKVWKEFTEKQPMWGHLVFKNLADTLYELGRFDEMESIYKKMNHKSTKRPDAALALAALYDKQGRFEETARLSQEIVDRHPESFKARVLLIKSHSALGKTHDAIAEALDVLSATSDRNAHFTCPQCGHMQETLLWHCPRCGFWKPLTEDEAIDA